MLGSGVLTPSDKNQPEKTPQDLTQDREQYRSKLFSDLETIVLFDNDFKRGLELSRVAIDFELSQKERSATYLGLAYALNALSLVGTGKTTEGYEQMQSAEATLFWVRNERREAYLFALSNMAVCNCIIGDRKNAGKLLDECEIICKALNSQPRLISSEPIIRCAESNFYFNRAIFLNLRRKVEPALRDAKKSLELTEKVFGAVHQAIIPPLQLVSKLAMIANHPKQALWSALRLVEVCEKLGAHPDVLIDTLVDLTSQSVAGNKFGLAKKYLSKAIDVAKRISKDSTGLSRDLRIMEAKVDVRDLLRQAARLRKVGKEDEAKDCLKQAAEISKLGVLEYQAKFDLGLALFAYQSYASSYSDIYSKKFILVDLYKAVEQHRRAFETQAPNEVTATLTALAQHLQATYDLQAAQRLLLDAYSIISKSKTVQPKLMFELLMLQGHISLSLDEAGRAEECFEEANEYLTEEPSMMLATCDLLRAQAFALQNKYQDAVQFSQLALESLPHGDPNTPLLKAEILLFLGDLKAKPIRTTEGFIDASLPESEEVSELYLRAQVALEDSDTAHLVPEIYAIIINRRVMFQISRALMTGSPEAELWKTCEQMEVKLNQVKSLLEHANCSESSAYANTLNNLGLCLGLLEYEEESEAMLKQADFLFRILEFKSLDFLGEFGEEI